MVKRDHTSFGKSLRSAEKKLTQGLIKWKLKRDGLPTPNEEILDQNSERIVDEAHELMKRQGRSILDEFKKTKKEFLKAYRDEDKDEK